MAKQEIIARPEPSKPAALIILVSVVGFGLLSKLLFPALGLSGPAQIGIWALWVLGTAFYLRQTGNGRVARIYLVVMFGILIFTGLAIYFFKG